MIQSFLAGLFAILLALLALIGFYCTFFSESRRHKRTSLFVGSAIVAALSVIIAGLGGV